MTIQFSNGMTARRVEFNFYQFTGNGINLTPSLRGIKAVLEFNKFMDKSEAWGNV